MSGDVVYSDVKFAKKGSKSHKPSIPNDEDVTYSEVKKKKSSADDDVTYAQVRKNKSAGAHSPQDNDVTYCTANVAPAPQESGPQPKKSSPETSKVKKLRVGVGIVLVLLVLAVIAGVICVCLHMKAQTDALTGASISTPMTTTTLCTTTTAPTSTAPCKLYCETDWELHKNKCFHFSTNKLTWNQSRDDCKSKSGRLVKIFGENKQKFLFDKVRSLMEDDEDKFWIGLTDSVEEGQWRWTDGSLLNSSSAFWFTRKKDGKTIIEPDNWNGINLEGEDCVRMGERSPDFEKKCWFDQDCNKLQKYICEKNQTCEKP